MSYWINMLCVEQCFTLTQNFKGIFQRIDKTFVYIYLHYFLSHIYVTNTCIENTKSLRGKHLNQTKYIKKKNKSSRLSNTLTHLELHFLYLFIASSLFILKENWYCINSRNISWVPNLKIT